MEIDLGLWILDCISKLKPAGKRVDGEEIFDPIMDEMSHCNGSERSMQH